MSLEPRALTRSASVAVANLSYPHGDVGRSAPARPDDGVARIAADIAGVLSGELDRYYDEWRRLFTTLHETLSPLGRLCETASRRNSPQFLSTLYPLLERLTEAAASEAHAAAQARDAAEMKVAAAQAALDRVETELQNARDELDTTRAEFALIAQQLEAERAERGRLEGALDAVQRALRSAETHRADGGPSDGAPRVETTTAPALSGELPPVVDLPAEPRPVSPSLALVRTTQPASADEGMERDEYARRLLHTVETTYWAGLDATAPGVKVVDRLTESLRQAREQFLGRPGTAESEGSSLFKRHLMARLESEWGTPFGRHLGIAIYELYPTRDEGQLRARAS